jgi:UDP-glucose 4-epimerase
MNPRIPGKIALVGGMGFIGSHIVKQMALRHEFVVVAKKNNLGLDDNYFRKTRKSVKGFVNLLSDVNAVVHLAAIRPESSGEVLSFEKYLPNIELSAAIFEACRQLNITNVVNISSMSVYSKINLLPFDESQDVVPKNLYGVAKKSVEDLAAFYNQFHGLCIKSLRLAQVIGLGEKEKFMFTTFLKQAAAGQTLKVWGKGEGRREYIYVKDVVSAVFCALDHFDVKGVFNIGTGVNTSHRELAQVINRVFGNENNLELLPENPEDNSISLMTVKKAKSLLSWQSEWSLEAALSDMKMDFFRQEETDIM